MLGRYRRITLFPYPQIDIKEKTRSAQIADRVAVIVHITFR